MTITKRIPPQPVARWSGRQERFWCGIPSYAFYLFYHAHTKNTRGVKDFARLLKQTAIRGRFPALGASVALGRTNGGTH